MHVAAVLVLGIGPDMPVTLPAAGSLAHRITRVAAITRQRKTPARATSVTLLGPLFRLLASTGLLRWFVNCHRLVHSFATDLHGPAQPLTFAGARLRAMIPVPNTTGDVPGHLRRAVLRRELSSASGLIAGEPPRAQNTPICTGTWSLDLDPQAARNGGDVRLAGAERRSRSVR